MDWTSKWFITVVRRLLWSDCKMFIGSCVSSGIVWKGYETIRGWSFAGGCMSPGASFEVLYLGPVSPLDCWSIVLSCLHVPLAIPSLTRNYKQKYTFFPNLLFSGNFIIARETKLRGLILSVERNLSIGAFMELVQCSGFFFNAWQLISHRVSVPKEAGKLWSPCQGFWCLPLEIKWHHFCFLLTYPVYQPVFEVSSCEHRTKNLCAVC